MVTVAIALSCVTVTVTVTTELVIWATEPDVVDAPGATVTVTKLVTVCVDRAVSLLAGTIVEDASQADDGRTLSVVLIVLVNVVVEVTVVRARTVAVFTADVTRDLTDAIALLAAPA